MTLELRARAAIARLDLLAYNPLQPRGRDGRWIKGGAGASPSTPDAAPPRPVRKRAPRAPARRASATDWLASPGRSVSTPETEKQIKELFNFTDPDTGLSAEAYAVEAGQNSIVAHVNIKNADGAVVGKAMRSVRLGKSGEPQVYHHSFNLGKRFQGGGFSSRWLRQMEDRYREAGIKEIGLTTSDVGGYAWAKAGFDFQDRAQAKLAATAINKLLTSKAGQRDLPQRVITDGLELVRRARTGGEDIPTPAEFAMLGWTPGAETWVGKEGMLGTSWYAVKEL